MTKDQIRELLLELGAPKGRVQDCVLIPEDVLERFAAAIRSATKEEDARICDDLEMRNTRSGPADCGAAIRASK